MNKGFTLIELLIVISILGILAVAVLSAINPVEQLKKARDARRKSDAAELLNANERYFTTFSCYPWKNLAGDCSTVATPTAESIVAASFAAGGTEYELVAKEELKTQFSSRDTVAKGELYLTEASTGQVSVCFSPESQSGRAGGMGPIMDQSNAAAGTCGAAYSANDPTCNVCVPQ